MSTENAKEKMLEEKAAKHSSQYLHKGKILQIRLDTFRKEGKEKTFEIVEHPGAVAILPITSSGSILLVRQWRRAAQEILLEIPAGTLEKREDPSSCAQRELREETGFYAHSLLPYGGFYTVPGFCTEFIHLFIAKELEKKPLPADDDEGIDLITVSLKEALQLIEKQEIKDAKTILALYKYSYEKK